MFRNGCGRPSETSTVVTHANRSEKLMDEQIIPDSPCRKRGDRRRLVPTTRISKGMGAPIRAALSCIRFDRTAQHASLPLGAQRRRTAGHPCVHLGSGCIRGSKGVPSGSQRAAVGARSRAARSGRQPSSYRHAKNVGTKSRYVLCLCDLSVSAVIVLQPWLSTVNCKL